MAFARFALTLALTAAGATALPGAARAAPPDPRQMEAVTELTEWPFKVEYDIRRGGKVRVPLGVLSFDARPIRGLVAKVEVAGDLTFGRRFRNCWYTTKATSSIMWCEFGTAVLPPHKGLAITTPMVAARADARPERVRGISFRWQSKAWSDARGGLRPVTAFFAGKGRPVVRGTGSLLTLTSLTLPIADIRTNANFAPVNLTNEPPLTPSPTPTSSPSPTAGATAAATPSRSAAAGGGGAGLPVTGTPTAALATAGGALLALGLAGYAIARRRTRFTA
ncbi:hypothetical protein Asp14428_56460 [Actinoplanes sp. NBRC 14428]|uniref:LPXTG-motif cell wall-anchored protein n=1 Tax=Pseudosporangium ferrugineum TaxID=439699 RepID=A0A2T0RDK4_9ACTN|nr:hypothetical protein [Pseudosporangium ferrugineum]PRY19242.1 hypothetical protein CLV70_1365 [Pseudosporangium ferrugineum]BCJ54171.1 hypothetical protein Asp14428_56460 [Actinoplanes sp. NBRC 14428]